MSRVTKPRRRAVVAVECELPPGLTATEFQRRLLKMTRELGAFPTAEPMTRINPRTVHATLIPRSLDRFLNMLCGGPESTLPERWFK